MQCYTHAICRSAGDRAWGCAATFGQNHSIAAAFGAQNSFVGDLFGDNSFSGLVDLGQTVFGNGTPTASGIATTILSGGGAGFKALRDRAQLGKFWSVQSFGLGVLSSAEGVLMNTRVITGIISSCLAITGLFLANLFLTMMIGEINRKRQDGNLVSYFGFTFPKMLRIFGEYRTSYPNGDLHMYALAAFALAMIGLVSVAVCLRIIGYGLLRLSREARPAPQTGSLNWQS